MRIKQMFLAVFSFYKNNNNNNKNSQTLQVNIKNTLYV